MQKDGKSRLLVKQGRLLYNNREVTTVDRVLPRVLIGLLAAVLLRVLAELLFGVLRIGLSKLPRRKEKPNTVELPRWMLVLGLGVGVPALVLSVILLRRGENVGFAVCMAFAILGGSLAFGAINQRVTYDEDGFTARSVFGISRWYPYDAINGIQGKTRDVKLFVGKRTVRIDEAAVGKDSFIAFAKKQYRQQHGGSSIPAVRSAGDDLFRGNLENTEGFVFAYVVLPIIFLVAFSFLIYAARPKPAEWEQSTVVFSAWSVGDEEIILREEGYEGYYRLERKYLTGEEALLDALERGESFRVLFHSYVGKNRKDPFRSVMEMADSGGQVYLSREDGLRQEKSDWLKLAAVLGAMALFYVLFSACAIVVGRHPERFGPRVVSLFFRKDYVRYKFE